MPHSDADGKETKPEPSAPPAFGYSAAGPTQSLRERGLGGSTSCAEGTSGALRSFGRHAVPPDAYYFTARALRCRRLADGADHPLREKLLTRAAEFEARAIELDDCAKEKSGSA